MIGIYKLTSPNGKCYIGQSHDIKKRMLQYKGNYNKSQRHIYNSINKYCWDNFKVDILWSSEDKTNSYFILNQLEEDFINLYDCLSPNGYNIRSGGLNTKMTDETKKKMSERRKGRKNNFILTEENHLKMNIAARLKNEIPIICFLDGEIFKEYKSILSCSLELNINKLTISRLLNGITKKSKCIYTFKRKEETYDTTLSGTFKV